MAGKLTDEIQSLVQRSGTNTGAMRTEAERASFSDNVRKDIAGIVYQLNTVYKELVRVLSSEQDLNALDYGLSGNVIYTHVRATEADADAYWSVDQARARTVKETTDVLLAEITRLENEIQKTIDQDEYDDTELRSLIQSSNLDLLQLAKDTIGPNYVLDGDGLPNLSYSISQALDAIGAFFSGFPGTGNTYTTTYPALSLTVRLSEIIVDSTLDQSAIDGLSTDLSAIRTFVGMDDAADSTPDYSTYGGSLVDIADGDSLEEAIWKLDQRTLERQVGHTTIRAQEWHKTQASAGPSLDVYDMTDYVVELRNFDNQAQEDAYTTIPIPVDEQGNRPSRVKLIGYFLLGPNGGPHPGGTGIAFNLRVGTGTGTPRTVGNKQLIDPGWDGPLLRTDNTLSASNVDNVVILEWPTITLTSNQIGILNLKLSRIVGDPADTWGDNVGLILMGATWYR